MIEKKKFLIDPHPPKLLQNFGMHTRICIDIIGQASTSINTIILCKNIL